MGLSKNYSKEELLAIANAKTVVDTEKSSKVSFEGVVTDVEAYPRKNADGSTFHVYATTIKTSNGELRQFNLNSIKDTGAVPCRNMKIKINCTPSEYNDKVTNELRVSINSYWSNIESEKETNFRLMQQYGLSPVLPA